jgi:hypothetical protein
LVATCENSCCVGTWMIGTSTGLICEPFEVGMNPS